MPYQIVSQEDEFCIYKEDTEGQPAGEAIACHETREAAEEQMAALYAAEEDDDTKMVGWGGKVKALGGGRIGGQLVRYGSPEDRDLEGEYFTAETYYGPHKGDGADVLVHHGHPIIPGEAGRELADRLLTPMKVTENDLGLWAETVLDMADSYERMVYGMVERGKMGWSSATAGHLYKATDEGAIIRWPIIEGSLTPTPAEPRNSAMTLKAYMLETEEAIKALAAEDVSRDTSPGEIAEPVRANPSEKASKRYGGNTMLKVFESGGQFHVCEVDEAGEPQGVPVRSYDNDRDAYYHAGSGKAVSAEPAPEPEPVMDPDIVAQKAVDAAMEKVTAWMQEMAEDGTAGKFLSEKPPEKVADKYEFNDFIKAVAGRDIKALKAMGSVKVMGEDGSSGNFLVPVEFRPDLIRTATEESIVRQRAFVVPATTGAVAFPALDMTGSTAGQPHTTGGVVATPTETSTSKTETEADFAMIELIANEISGITYVKNSLLHDSPISVSVLLQRLFGEAIAWEEDYLFLRGTGAGQPLGVLNAGALLTVNREAANSIAYKDVVRMAAKLMPRADQGAVWVCNRLGLEFLMQLQDGAGNIIWAPNARDVNGLSMPLLGYPVLWSEKLPAVGTTGDLILCNFGWYYIADCEQLSIGSSEHYLFTANQTTFRFSERIDGQPALKSAVYMADGSNQVSPFVALSSTVS